MRAIEPYTNDKYMDTSKIYPQRVYSSELNISSGGK